VVRTASGYTGGTKPDPTYRSLGDHTESVEVEYDPSRVTYRELLRIFWNSHDPGSRAWSRQYRTAVFYRNEEQRRLVLETRAEVEARLGRPVRTDVEPVGRFYPAEDYHQKYSLKRHPALWDEVRTRYPSDREAEASTLAARLNGLLAGYGAPSSEELGTLGLTAEGADLLRAALGRTTH